VSQPATVNGLVGAAQDIDDRGAVPTDPGVAG